MLGTRLAPWLEKMGHAVSCHARRAPAYLRAELTNPLETRHLISSVNPEVVVNLAGLTDVDHCQSHPKEAWKANVLTVENVAGAARETGAHLVQVSTDQVYDGLSAQGEDSAAPGNVYGLSKYAGELAAKATAATVLRTNFFGASWHDTRRSFTDWLFCCLSQGRQIDVFDDVRFSPLRMSTLSEMIEVVAERQPLGVFNLGSRDGMSKADFAFQFAEALDLPVSLMTRKSVRDAQGLKAWRPANMCMDSTRFETEVGVTLPTLRDEINQSAKEYR